MSSRDFSWGKVAVPNVKYSGALIYPDRLGHLDGLFWVTFTFTFILWRNNLYKDNLRTTNRNKHFQINISEVSLTISFTSSVVPVDLLHRGLPCALKSTYAVVSQQLNDAKMHLVISNVIRIFGSLCSSKCYVASYMTGRLILTSYNSDIFYLLSRTTLGEIVWFKRSVTTM
jgi:hypothetical protein